MTNFNSPAFCVFKGHFKRNECQRAFLAAKRIYAEKVMKFASLAQCNAQYRTCTIYRVSSGRRALRRQISYAPPFLGIGVGDGKGLGKGLGTVFALIGVERSALKVDRQQPVAARAPIHEAKPTAAPDATAPEAAILNGSLFSDPLPGEVLTYPVPARLMPHRIAP